MTKSRFYIIILEKIMSVLVTQQAPDFTSAAVLADGSIVDNFTLSSFHQLKMRREVQYLLDEQYRMLS
jgi:hypothetical protein